jgi:DeoR/GlpR family transcriptional regulator of sugar metabolism
MTEGTQRTRDRRSRIMELLEEREFVSVAELAETFQLTEMSVRRDLTALSSEGRVTRVRGGATRPRVGQTSRGFAAAVKRNPEEKAKIAEAAAKLVEPGATFFYSGSTVARVASCLPPKVRPALTMVTNSLPLIDEVTTWLDPHLVAIGGLYLPQYMAFVGPQTIDTLQELSADIAVVGCDGLSAEGGLTTPHQLVAEVGAMMIERAQRTIVVADYTKVGRRGFTPIAAISDVDVLVTDTQSDPAEIAALREMGLEVILV